MTAPLILTLALDARSFAFFDEQRKCYFPPDRNHIPAHLTLFHALPGEELAAITGDIREICTVQEPFTLAVACLRSLGRGVAYQLHSPDLADLRDVLAERWALWLGSQDRQKHSPHVTVQNKVDPAVARATLGELESTFAPFTAQGQGLDLWWYQGGPWERVGTFPFRRHQLDGSGPPAGDV